MNGLMERLEQFLAGIRTGSAFPYSDFFSAKILLIVDHSHNSIDQSIMITSRFSRVLEEKLAACFVESQFKG